MELALQWATSTTVSSVLTTELSTLHSQFLLFISSVATTSSFSAPFFRYWA